MPFEFDPGAGALCGFCARDRWPYERARAAIVYDDGSRGLILGFKHGDRTDAAPAFGRWMARAGGELIADADVIVPVPLHWTRLFARRYNQSALLAQTVGRLSGAPVAPDLLFRSRRTPSLRGLGPTARLATVRRAFAVRSRQASRLAGRRVLLIDDVYTTGSTTGACTETLLEAGARAVDVLTLARVVRPSI